MKKKIFGIAFVFSMILGIAFSFVPQEASAVEGGGNKIPCWSSGTYTGVDTYVSCSTCTDKDGYKATGGAGKCTPGAIPN